MTRQIKPIEPKLSAVMQRQLDIADWAKEERLKMLCIPASLLGNTNANGDQGSQSNRHINRCVLLFL